MKISILFTCVMAVAILTGCTGLNNKKSVNENNNLQISKFSQIQSDNVANVASLPIQQITGKLQLEMVLNTVLDVNPIIESRKHKVNSARHAVNNAGAFPNPELKVEVDEFGGTGELSGTDAMTKTIGISQAFELGGKRGKRIFLAEQELQIAKLELKETKLNYISKASLAYLSVFIAQENLKLEQEALVIVQKNFNIVTKRIKSGDISPVQKNKAEVELVTAEIAVTRAKRKLNILRKELVNLWGNKNPKFAKVANLKIDLHKKLIIDNLEKKLHTHPSVLKIQTLVAREKAVVKLNKANAWGNLKVSGGVSSHNENDEESYSLGISIPFPIFNRNQDAVAVSESKLEEIKKIRVAELMNMQLKLTSMYDKLELARSELIMLNTQVIPATERSYQATLTAFEAGEENFIDVLDTQRTLLKTKKTRLNMESEVYELIIKLNNIVGK